MIKRKFKIILILFSVFCIFFTSLSYATENDLNLILSDNMPTSSSDNESENINSNTINNDLYLFDNTIVLDSSVDGNVYAIGKDVEITGKINGNLYVLGNNITIQSPNEEDPCYITGSVYLCGNQIFFDSLCGDLYVAANNFTGSYNSYVDRDLRLGCENALFYGLVARNAYVNAKSLSFKSEESDEYALINGNLDYSCRTELSLDESVVKGNVIFNHIDEKINDKENTKSLSDYIKDLIASIVCTIIVYLLIKWLTPKFKENIKKYISIKLLPSIGIGLAFIVLIPVLCIILLITIIGIPLSILLLLTYIIVIIISFPILVISVAEFFREKLKSKNIGTDLLILICVNIVSYLLKQIPYVGGWVGFIFMLIGIGIVVIYLFTKNKKEKSEENKEVVNTNL